MNSHIKEFLQSVDSKTIESKTRWAQTAGDSNFFNECAKKLHSLGVKLVLDIACGKGKFVKICNDKYSIEAYGIDPNLKHSGQNPNLYNGTFESVLVNEKLLGDIQFDCISIQNTLHGKHWKDDELKKLFRFIRKYSKYVVMSPPHISNGGVKLLQLHGFKQIHKFGEFCSKNYAIHRIYEVTDNVLIHENIPILDSLINNYLIRISKK